MSIKKQVAFALCTLLIAASAATARGRRDALPETISTPAASAQVTPDPTPVDRGREELERLQQENLIRDRVQSEVDRAFGRATILFNAWLLVLALLPIAMAIGLWLLHRSIVYQLASERKNLLEQFRDSLEKQLATEISTVLKGQMEVFKQETAAIRTETMTQITSLISEAQTVLEDLRQQREIVEQQINTLRDEQYYQTQNLAEQGIEPLNDHLSELLEIASDDPYEFAAQYEESESESSSQALDADGYLHQGNALFSEGRYVDANSAYSEAIKIDRDFSTARYQNARCYSIRGKVNLAIGNLQWAIDLDPQYKEIAKTDSAFDAIREDEQFKKMFEL